MTKILTSIVDNRSGNKLELVLCIKNDFERALNFIRKYHHFADIVLLSDDPLIDIDIFISTYKNFKITIFKREVSDLLTENYFIEYLNNFSISCRALFICTDEFIQPDLISKIDNAISLNYIIKINRIDYLLYKKIKVYKKIIRGGSKGDFRVSPTSQPHINMDVINTDKKYLSFNIHHFSDQKFILEYKKIVNYVNLENIIFSKHFSYPLNALNRYLVNLIRDIVDLRILFRAGFLVYLYNFFINIFCLSTFFIIFIENKVNIDSNKKILDKYE